MTGLRRDRLGALIMALALTGIVHAQTHGLNQPAPAFASPALDGRIVDLARLQGKVVVLNFWGTWCEPCRKETPDLIALRRRFAEADLAVIGVALDQDHDAEVAAFAKRYGVNYPIVPAGAALARGYGVLVAPTTLVLDRRGVIQFRRVGAVSREQLEAWVAALL